MTKPRSTNFPTGSDPIRMMELFQPAAAPGDDTVEPVGAVKWDAITAAEAEREWTSLRDWVEALIERFEFIDHHVVPDCWWKHNQLVEALAALRDHERSSFGALPNPALAVEWIRALRDISMLLRSWTADLPCAGGHRPSPARIVAVDESEWQRHLAREIDRRP